MDGSFDPVEEAAWFKVGAELRRLRTARGISLSQLARQVHYSTGYLSKIETGKKRITPEVACLVDEALDTGGVLAALLPGPECPLSSDEPDPTGSDVCPYPGLAAFGPQEVRWFFGRDQVTSYLINRLDARLGGGGPLAVVAPSGAGKSSLLAAGLIPALARGALTGSRSWPVVAATPGVHPLVTLTTRVAEQIGDDPAKAAAATADPERFAAFLTATVADPGGKAGETSSSSRIVLIIDQFEETFTECQNEAERQAFIAALGTAAKSSTVLVVLGVRADFYGPCLTYPPLVTALRDPVALGPMSTDQLREIIIGPAEAEGFQVEPGLVELLLRDLGVTDDSSAAAAGYDPGSLPLLAHALRASWQQRMGRMLTVAGYQRTGGIRKAIAITAENAYARLSPPDQQIAQQLLLRLVHVHDGTGEVRRRLPRDRLLQALPGPAEVAEKVLETFGRARMLTFDNATVEITHEALLRAWPRLADLISADRAGLRIHQMLSEATEAWEAENRDPSLLYRGSRLAIAQDWAVSPGHQAQLNSSEQGFLDASIDQKQREQLAERRRTRRLRTLVGVLAMSLTVALVTGGIALQQYHAAVRQRHLAIVGELVANSQSLAARDPAASMLLAVEAYHREPTPQALSALLSAQSQYYTGQLLGHTGIVYTTTFSHDGRVLATTSADGTARLWDVSSHQPIATLDNHVPSYGAEFSPDDRILAIAGRDGTARLWDVASHHQIENLTGSASIPLYVATFSHHSGLLATTDRDGVARLWDVADHHQIVALNSNRGAVYGAEFSPDDRILATTCADGTTLLWGVASHQPIATLDGHTGRTNNVTFSPDGRILAIAGHDTTITLWDVTSHQVITKLAGHTGPVNAVAFSPDGSILVTGSGDGTARLWNVSTHQQISTLQATTSIVGVAFSPDGHTVATGSEDNIARLWDISGAVVIPLPPTIGLDANFSPDGRILAAAGEDGTVRLYDATSHRQITTLAGHSGPVETVVFSPDGRIVATVGADGTTRFWDLPNHHLIASLDGHVGLRAVDFNHDGSILVTAGDDGVVRLWDAASHRITAALTGHTGVVYAARFSHRGELLASAGADGVVQLWDPANDQRTGTLTGHNGTINKLAFSPDDRVLATASDDGTVQLWDVANRRQITSLTGQAGAVNSVAFSKDGDTLVTAGADTTTKLWNVHNQQLVATLAGHTAGVYGVTLNPSSDQRLLATVGGDTTVRLWDLDPNRVTDRICHIIGNTNRAQWGRLIPGLPYRPTCH